jgi:putative ABC transport system permease protein
VTLVALKGLANRKLRASLTAFAIVLGVAMISGAFVLTDTISKAFDSITSQTYKNADVVISGKSAFENPNGNGTDTPSFPQSLLPEVQRLSGVADAQGAIEDQTTQLVDSHGKTISTGGAPAFGFSVDPRGDQRFNPMKLTSGSWPAGANEVAIDTGVASKRHLRIGDTIGVQARGPTKRFRIAGIVKLSGISIGGATIAVFDLPTAQALYDKRGKLDLIRVQSKPGLSNSRLVSEIRPLLPPHAQVRDVAAQAKKDKQGAADFLSIIRTALLAFGGIALFVGSFVIANTLSITIAQQVREFATLRTLGASRRQILWTVIVEALMIGLAASVAGLFLGLAIAKLLNWIFVAAGIDLPTTGTVFAPRTIVVALVVGVVITLLASLRPALRATRVPPIAAVREGATLPPSRFARFRTISGTILGLIGLVLLALGIFKHGQTTAAHLLEMGVGLLLLFFGVTIFTPKLVPPFAAVLGWPATKFAGVAGELARENARRNAARTASTAAALMIGLALVTFVAVLGAGLRSSFEDAVNKIFVGDYALTAKDTFTPITVQGEKALEHASGVTAISGVRAGSGRYLGSVHDLTAVEPNAAKVLSLDWKEGSNAVFGSLGRNGMFTDDDFAKTHHLHVGSIVRIQVPTGEYVNTIVKGVFKKPKGGSPFGQATISAALFDAKFPRPQNEFALMNLRGGVSPANTSALNRRLHAFPNAKIVDQAQFKTNFEKPINSLLSMLYALLGLSVIVSVFGIINTLVLTVFERTRELGMLRAVGMVRRQVRQMITHESITTALIGAVLGMGIGLLLSVLVTQELSSEGFTLSIPYKTLLVFVLAAVLVGIVAALLPARRASRLRILEALQYE